MQTLFNLYHINQTGSCTKQTELHVGQSAAVLLATGCQRGGEGFDMPPTDQHFWRWGCDTYVHECAENSMGGKRPGKRCSELALLLDMEKLMLAEMLLQDGAITMV